MSALDGDNAGLRLSHLVLARIVGMPFRDSGQCDVMIVYIESLR